MPVPRPASIERRMLRNWEHNFFSIDPAVQALLLVPYRKPEAALCALHHDETTEEDFQATRHRGALVGDIQDRTLLLTDYSPAFT